MELIRVHVFFSLHIVSRSPISFSIKTFIGLCYHANLLCLVNLALSISLTMFPSPCFNAYFEVLH